MGLEPTPGPWQGPVLPLYYDRPEQENFITSPVRRQDRIGTRICACNQTQKRTRARLSPYRMNPAL